MQLLHCHEKNLQTGTIIRSRILCCALFRQDKSGNWENCALKVKLVAAVDHCHPGQDPTGSGHTGPIIATQSSDTLSIQLTSRAGLCAGH